jgi:Na+/melibiose symporter-like transporter
VFVFVLTFYLQNGLGYSPLASSLIYLPMGIGFLISSLLTPKIVPKLETGMLKIGTIIMIAGYGLVVITAQSRKWYWITIVATATVYVHNWYRLGLCSGAFD